MSELHAKKGCTSVREFCLRILRSGDLASKLAAPGELVLTDAGPALHITAPVRSADIQMSAGGARLPKLSELGDPSARSRCLRRFAHHELMAVELFAWALLRWPDAPNGLRRAWLDTLRDEQRHTRLYLDRLRAHGEALGEEPLSDYFWKHVGGIGASHRGPLAFVCAMGLTLEQANLDFTARYARAFHAVGDPESARVLDQVHRDELAHVGSAARWLRRLCRPGESEIDAYRAAVPFPFGPARAKGRPFDAEARRRAGLSDALIEWVRTSRSTQEAGHPLGE